MAYYLKLGDWEAFVHPYSPEVDLVIIDANKHFGTFLSNRKETGKTPYSNHLVVGTPIIFDNQRYPDWLLKRDRELWDNFFSLLTAEKKKQSNNETSKLYGFWTQQFEQIGGQDRKEYASLKGGEIDRFSAIVFDSIRTDSHILLFVWTLFLANRWHIEHGGLCIHSSAVIAEENGYVFLGPSETGKTTVALQSNSIGYSALGDDLNFILCDKENNYKVAAAPGFKEPPLDYAKKTPLIKGIFILHKDIEDSLIPISKTRLARHLFESTMQIPKVKCLTFKETGAVYRTCCKIARQVPGFELHFRKSPDFWKLIDRAIPNSYRLKNRAPVIGE